MQAKDIDYMRLALDEAAAAARLDEVPVGAVLVQNGTVLAAAHNRRELDENALAHAEVLAINEACQKAQSWRLLNSTLYVTLEPCAMCVGAIINSRIDRVVYGAGDPKAGCCGSVLNLFEYPFNHTPQVEGGLLADESSRLLKDFFTALRQRKKEQNGN